MRQVLTPREREIEALLLDGLMLKDIAARLGIAHRTAMTHAKHIYDKRGVRSQAGLMEQEIQALRRLVRIMWTRSVVAA